MHTDDTLAFESTRDDPAKPRISVTDQGFRLQNDSICYEFHVDDDGELIGDHFGSRVTEKASLDFRPAAGLPTLTSCRREYADLGRGDFRLPAIRIRQADGCTVCHLRYRNHQIAHGKPTMDGLPVSRGKQNEVSTLVIYLFDELCGLEVELFYSIFQSANVIARSARIVNKGSKEMIIERAASLCVDFPRGELDMTGLRGDWGREGKRFRRSVDYGVQGYGSVTGYSSHFHNPFLALSPPTTTETTGETWAFSLLYSGSFQLEVEKGSYGTTRILIGLNPLHLSYRVAPGQSLQTPECIAAFSTSGFGGVSRTLHRFYRKHLMSDSVSGIPRPVLLNSWEAVYFDFDESRILSLARQTADAGIKLFVLDDGWFGEKYPRVDSRSGLGDWYPNPRRFPHGLGPFIEKINSLKVANSDETLLFGLWIEPEMVNPQSQLYQEHPEWVLKAGHYERTMTRNQLVLDISLDEVQAYIIDAVSTVLQSGRISYIKWDNNRYLHEMPDPSKAHLCILGLYRVLEHLTSSFPHVMWEGCASGGGRLDAGLLRYFPVSWTSDNTDALDRLHIQTGISLAYPATSMGCHISAVPNHQTKRSTPFSFRAHVAMMGGSFGLEMDPSTLTQHERSMLPSLLALQARIAPMVSGDIYRLALPDESNWPATLFLAEDRSAGALFHFQLKSAVNEDTPMIRLQGLDAVAMYSFEGEQKTLSGVTLMNRGIQFRMEGDYQSQIVVFKRVER